MKNETVFSKAAGLKKKYGAAKAIEIIQADKNRHDRSNEWKKSVDCHAVIQRLKSGQI